MLVLGIESTCDETACAVVRDGSDILSNIIASQIDLHQIYGGVVPELACRRHVDVMIPVIRQALDEAKVQLQDIDLFAVAYGPGLIGALLIGLNTAKTLALALEKPFIGINHIEAHLYAALMSHNKTITFPCLGVVLSGGHTTLVRMKDVGSYELIGQTVDDALGEAFDKAAKMLGLPYPGGPAIEALAKDGDPTRFRLRAGQVKGRPLDFSFSGLKTAVLYTIQGLTSHGKSEILSFKDLRDLAASFQTAALEDIVKKTLLAASKYGIQTVILGGGVTNNQVLRELFRQKNPHMEYLWPSAGLTMDNAAMIAGLGYHRYLRQGQQGDPIELEPMVRIPFT